MRLVRGRDRKFYVKHQEDLYASQTLPGAFVPMVGLMIIVVSSSHKLCIVLKVIPI